MVGGSMVDWHSLPGRIVVCAPASLPPIFSNDLFGDCAVCGQRVRFRPHVPVDHSLVCLACFVVNADDDQMCALQPESVEELKYRG